MIVPPTAVALLYLARVGISVVQGLLIQEVFAPVQLSQDLLDIVLRLLADLLRRELLGA